MADQNLVDLLKKGADAWNDWRAKNDPPELDDAWEDYVDLDLRKADLSGLDLSNADLAWCDLFGANLQGANLTGVEFFYVGGRASTLAHSNLQNANLTRTDLRFVDLSRADFRNAHFEYTALAGAAMYRADLTGAKLAKANLSGADLTEAILQGVDLSLAKLRKVQLNEAMITERANLSEADLTDADLTRADLSNAILKETVFRNAITRQTILTGAWIENAKDLVFDSTLTRGAAFPTTAQDPWSILRRNYTGSHLLFHMLFLVATLLPYVVRTAAWLAVNRVQSYVTEQEAKLQAFASEQDKKSPEERGIKFGSGAISITIDDNTLKGLAQTKPCLAANCTQTPVWKILLGLDLPFPYWVLPLCSGMWGVMRMILIFKIGPLSDLEDRSGFTPAWPRRQVSLGGHQSYSYRITRTHGVNG